jgi:uncharacterized protein YndB with AHSA1/START domain
MAIQTCPTDIVAAPAQRIWKLLTQPTQLAAWLGARLIDGPTHTLVAGDRIVLAPGFGMRVIFEVLAMEPLRQLALDAHLPFGVVNHEVIQILQAGAEGCRVTFN